MTMEPIDFTDLSIRAGNDQALAREVLTDLLAIVEAERPLLRDECAGRAFEAAARRTHRLRGSLLAVGAGWAARRALRLEEAAEQNAVDIEHALVGFENALDDAVDAIRDHLGKR